MGRARAEALNALGGNLRMVSLRFLLRSVAGSIPAGVSIMQ